MRLNRFVTGIICFVILGGFNPVDAAELLRRSQGSWFFGPKAMYSNSTTVTIFFPMSEPMPSAGLFKARFAYQMTQNTGLCELRPAFRYSSDGVNWDTPKIVTGDSQATDETIIYDPGYTDLTDSVTQHAWIQFGLVTLNTSGSAIASCYGTLRVEPVL